MAAVRNALIEFTATSMTSNIPSIPDALRRLMAEVGPRWSSAVQHNVGLMLDGFSHVLTTAPKVAEVTRNVSYGRHPRQVLDVYRPAPASVSGTSMPVLMFVHGGAYVEGDKDRTSEIYSNVLWYFARHGVLGLNVEYRLAPESQFPGGTDDIAAAVAWARSHAGGYGGDGERIFIYAHSAGAAHAAHYAYDRRFHPAEGPGIAGLIVVSGRVRAENGPGNPNAKRVEAYYGVDEARMEEGSGVNYIDAGSLPTMIAVAQYENPLIDMHCVELFHRLAQAKRRAPRFVWMAGHNHTSIVAHFNTAEDFLGRQMLQFIEQGW
jgi:acetyl esterase/lipase